MQKRIFDILIAGFLLVVTLPGWLVIAYTVRRSSEGPIFFLQHRTGQNGRRFQIVKFRTMYLGSDGVSAKALAGDPRVTRVGRTLRRYYLDELPQLLNVLRGDMSMVGPRPLPLYCFEGVVNSPAYLKRHSVRPGLTGLVQIRGRAWEAKRSTAQLLRIDLIYVRKSCLLLDIKLLFFTIWTVLVGKGM